jgi:hypothetical protein
MDERSRFFVGPFKQICALLNCPWKLGGTDRNLRDCVKSLCSDNPHDAIEWLYTTLTVLDTKATGLLAFNALIATAGGIATTKFPTKLLPVTLGDALTSLSWLLMVAAWVFLVRACFECLNILNVEYVFLGNGAGDDKKFEKEISELATVVDGRTDGFMRARNWSLLGFALLTIACVFIGAWHIVCPAGGS